MWPSVAECLEALEMKTRAEALQIKSYIVWPLWPFEQRAFRRSGRCGRLSRGLTNENQSRGATCQNPIEALQIKIHIFFSPLKPLQMMSGRFWPCVFEFAPKAPRNSYLFAPKARQNHVWPFVFHFLNSPLNPAEIEIRVEALEIKI